MILSLACLGCSCVSTWQAEAAQGKKKKDDKVHQQGSGGSGVYNWKGGNKSIN